MRLLDHDLYGWNVDSGHDVPHRKRPILDESVWSRHMVLFLGVRSIELKYDDVSQEYVQPVLHLHHVGSTHNSFCHIST